MPKKVTPHWLRYSEVMHLLQAGVNLVYIRDLLGNADITYSSTPPTSPQNQQPVLK